LTWEKVHEIPVFRTSDGRSDGTGRSATEDIRAGCIMNAILPRPAYEDATMRITFPDDTPGFNGSSLTVQFMAQVDGEPVLCAITAEALEDHFGAQSALEEVLLKAFEQGRGRIRSVCAEELDRNDGGGVVLHSGLFRVEGMEPGRR
jgi:hypothetical protein